MAGSTDQARTAGQPDPLEARRCRPIGGLFAAGVEIDNAAASTVLIPIAGALLVRLRGKITTTEVAPPAPMGVLSFAYRRPDTETSYSVSLDAPHADANVVKDTEFLVDIAPGGEPYLAVTFTPDVGVGALEVISATFFDTMQQ